MLKIIQREFFLNEFEKGQILKKDFDLMETTFFVKTDSSVDSQWEEADAVVTINFGDLLSGPEITYQGSALSFNDCIHVGSTLSRKTLSTKDQF